jgi:hypothetical protein
MCSLFRVRVSDPAPFKAQLHRIVETAYRARAKPVLHSN